ncbi:MAG: hypothetical protein ACR2MG_04245 [Pyrinomonadaceae bacterium]
MEFIEKIGARASCPQSCDSTKEFYIALILKESKTFLNAFSVHQRAGCPRSR